MTRRFILLAVAVGCALVEAVSADDNVRAVQPPHLTILAGGGTTSYGA